MEIRHGREDAGHESERCMLYAARVLDKFAEELMPFSEEEPGADWRSAILTPILQRQMAGVSDAYSWATNAGIAHLGEDDDDDDPEKEEFTDDTGDEDDRVRPTILQATRAYLTIDPLDPQHIPSYRRNLLYVREMRWHLSVVTLNNTTTAVQMPLFVSTLKNQDFLQEALGAQENGLPEDLTLAELIVIALEEISGFYEPEISRLVRLRPLVTEPPH